MANILPDSIRQPAHVQTFDRSVEERFRILDLTPLLVYLIDTVPSSALPYLAEQFDVLGYKGWKYADTEQKKRDLIKRSIEIHRTKGTPWSIKEALKIVGIMDAEIEEGIGWYYNQQFQYNAAIFYGGGSWATFRVIINGNTFMQINQALADDIRNLILEYKNARSWLLDISFKLDVSESVAVAETMELGPEIDDDSSGIGILYDNTGLYDGNYSYNQNYDNDIIINVL